MSARETHWSLSIQADAERRRFTATCGCGWTREYPDGSARSIKRARVDWDEHECEGRPLRAGASGGR